MANLTNSHLSIIHANIRSMKCNFDNFLAEFLNFSKLPDVIGLCETRLSDDTQKLYKLDNFSLLATNVSDNKGGVCLYVSNIFESKIRADLCITKEHIETIFAECTFNEKRFVIGVVYHRPGSSLASFQDDLASILERINSQCILMGDLNVNILNENDVSTINFVNLMKEYMYSPMITKPTRVTSTSATLLDQIWINFEQANGYLSKIAGSGLTDHYPVIFYLESIKPQNMFKSISFRRKGETHDNLFKTNLMTSNIQDILLIEDVNEAFECFNDIIYNTYNESYPITVKNINLNSLKNPWITSGLKESIKTKNRLYKKIVKRPITHGDTYRNF